MKIAILSRNASLYSTSRLLEAASARGHEVEVIDYLKCYMDITSQQPRIQYKGRLLPCYDALIPRIGAKRTFYGTAIARQFETMGTYSINRAIAISRSRDKLRSYQLLAMQGVDMPTTGFAHFASDVNNLINIVGGPPLIIKLIEGTQGVGVVLAETKKAAKSVIEAMMGINANIIVQEFIQESNGADIRCIVIGNKVVAAMERTAEPGEFRSNVHKGGSAKVTKISRAEREAAIKAAKIMGLRFAGVDLLRSHRGPLIMEVNSSPGLQAIEAATGKDIASMLVEYIEKHAKPIHPRSRYEG